MSHISPTTGYALGIAIPMLVFGLGQGFGLSTLTTAGMADVSPQHAGCRRRPVNGAHHLGGALGLGALVTVFDAAGGGAHGSALLADRVAASLMTACVFLALALAVTVVVRPWRRATTPPAAEEVRALAATVAPGHPAAETLRDSRACA